MHHQPPKAQPGGATNPRQELGPQPRLWGWVSLRGTTLAPLLVFLALDLPVLRCLGVPRRAASVLAPAGEHWAYARPLGRSWKLHHLESLSRLKVFPHAWCPHCALYMAQESPQPLFSSTPQPRSLHHRAETLSSPCQPRKGGKQPEERRQHLNLGVSAVEPPAEDNASGLTVEVGERREVTRQRQER